MIILKVLSHSLNSLCGAGDMLCCKNVLSFFVISSLLIQSDCHLMKGTLLLTVHFEWIWFEVVCLGAGGVNRRRWT